MRLCNFSYGEDSRAYVQALYATSARCFGFCTKPLKERTSTQTGKAQAGLGWRTGRVQRKIYLHETAKRILELVGRLSYLVDSNVWLELLLEQERAEEVRQFLSLVQLHEIAITEFTLYSIGIIACLLNKDDLFAAFISDILEDTGIKRISLSLSDIRDLLVAIQQHGLDFDDAYQYIAARNSDLILVSFDKDFDKTDIKRTTPAMVLTKRADYN